MTEITDRYFNDLIARLEVVADDRFGSDARDRNLTIRIVHIGEEHIPGHLSVDADRLDLLENALARAFQHR